MPLNVQESQARFHLLLATLFFSLMQICVKLLSHIPSMEIAFFRGLIALVLGFTILKLKGIPPLGSKHPLLWIRGFLGTLALICFFYSLQNLELAPAVTIQYIAPLLTVLFAGLFFKEPATVAQWIFFLAAFLGVFTAQGLGSGGGWLAFAAGIFSSVLSALAYNTIRLLADKDDPNVVVLYFPLVTVPLLLWPTLLQWVAPVGVEWLYVLGVGVFTQGAQVYMTKAYQAAEAAKIVDISFLGVPFAAIFGWLLFYEWPNAWQFVGMCIVITSVILSSRYGKRGKVPKPT